MNARIPSNNRTKIGNGLRLHHRPKFGGPDMRSREGRRLAELHADILAELGRQPTATEHALIRLKASLTVRLEEMARDMAVGFRVDTNELTALEASLKRTDARLGLGGKGEPEHASLVELMDPGQAR